MSVGSDAAAEVLAAPVLGVEERHGGGGWGGWLLFLRLCVVRLLVVGGYSGLDWWVVLIVDVGVGVCGGGLVVCRSRSK